MGHMRENEGSEQKKKKRQGERGGWRGGERGSGEGDGEGRERKKIYMFILYIILFNSVSLSADLNFYSWTLYFCDPPQNDFPENSRFIDFFDRFKFYSN